MCEKIFITFKKEVLNSEWVNDNWVVLDYNVLGYAARYNPASEKCNKKNQDQLNWVRGYFNDYIVEEDGLYYIIRRPSGKKELFDFQPQIIDNVPMSGFKIAKFVSRYSTSNKLWRIDDPRGFQLEISTSNMEDVLQEGSVVKGEILGLYKWDFGKNGIGKAKLIKVED